MRYSFRGTHESITSVCCDDPNLGHRLESSCEILEGQGAPWVRISFGCRHCWFCRVDDLLWDACSRGGASERCISVQFLSGCFFGGS
ncbi:hypothetical protein DP46_6029 [Burkholderia phage BEK]|uniref:Uncharacterized protein n=1 Tax=Burkholderia phage BEK TaxID=1514988 RepID=A0A4P1QFK9_9CAUD|nr:hypothetical protein DP46_6029 [Burkholderia phage BEK]